MGMTVFVLSGPGVQPNELPESVHILEYRSIFLRPFSLSWRRYDLGTGGLLKSIIDARPDLIHVHTVLGLGEHFIEWISSGSIPYVISVHDYYLACPRIFMIDVNSDVCREVDLRRCENCVGLLDQSDVLRKLAMELRFQLPRVRSSMPMRRAAAMRKFLGNADKVLPVSSRVAEIISGFCPSARSEVCHIGSASAGGMRHTKTQSLRIRAVLIGTLSRIKGAFILEALIRGVDSRRIEFHFYGRAESAELGERLQRSGLVMHGSYSPNQMPEIMREADLGLVLPIWEDNGPQVAMEFINYGIPVLGTRMGGIPDFVKEGYGRLFDPYNDDEVKEVIQWLNVLTRDTIDSFAKNLRPLISPEEHAEKIRTLYGAIVQGHV